MGKAYRVGTLTGEDSTGDEAGRARLRPLTPSLKRSVGAPLKPVPRCGGGAARGGSGALPPLYVVGDNYTIHTAQAVAQWRAAHPRMEVRFLPTDCPKARPIERALGDVPDKGTRHHKRKRLWSVVQDVEPHLGVNGPWHSEVSEIY